MYLWSWKRQRRPLTTKFSALIPWKITTRLLDPPFQPLCGTYSPTSGYGPGRGNYSWGTRRSPERRHHSPAAPIQSEAPTSYSTSDSDSTRRSRSRGVHWYGKPRAAPLESPLPLSQAFNMGSAMAYTDMMPPATVTILPPQMPDGGNSNISATFSVPGKMSIPSDRVSHTVTITELSLETKMSWVCVPKQNTKAHLSVCISCMLKNMEGN